MGKISSMPPDTSINQGDVVPLVDTSSANKKVSISTLIANFFSNAPAGSVANAALSQNVAWTSYTPTFANTTLGNGTVAGSYQQIGKTVVFKASFVLGSTSSVGSGPTVTLPVTAASTNMSANTSPLGISVVLDSGNADYPGILYYFTTTTAKPFVDNASATYVVSNAISATVPITFGTADAIYVYGTYEAA